MNRSPILEKVFAYYGGQTVLANKLGLSRQCVNQWKAVPLKYLKLICKQTKITRKELRPDLYA